MISAIPAIKRCYYVPDGRKMVQMSNDTDKLLREDVANSISKNGFI